MIEYVRCVLNFKSFGHLSSSQQKNKGSAQTVNFFIDLKFAFFVESYSNIQMLWNLARTSHTQSSFSTKEIGFFKFILYFQQFFVYSWAHLSLGAKTPHSSKIHFLAIPLVWVSLSPGTSGDSPCIHTQRKYRVSILKNRYSFFSELLRNPLWSIFYTMSLSTTILLIGNFELSWFIYLLGKIYVQ